MNRSNGMILRGRNHHPDDFLMQSGIQLMEKIGEGQHCTIILSDIIDR